MGGTIDTAVDKADWIMFLTIITPVMAIIPAAPACAAMGLIALLRMSVVSWPMSKVKIGTLLKGFVVFVSTCRVTNFGPVLSYSQCGFPDCSV